MDTAKKISVGLSQFTEFTLKGTSAKTNMVRKIKYQEKYHPAFDYWKPLRDEIIKFHSQNLEIECFENLVKKVDQKKKTNFVVAIKQYQKFIKNKDIIWFDPGKATWLGDELTVRSSPELGLIIDGEPHLVKLYFKGKSDKIEKRNINTTLTLMNTSIREKAYNFTANNSVFNLNKSRLFTENKFNDDMLIALESEASQFMFIWNKV
jgi:hypothetical protein